MNAGDLGYNKRFSDQYIVVSINSKKLGKPKDIIKNAVKQANNEEKDVLVLSGKQCHMAATIKECDIVLLLNDITSYDMIKQMMYRSMSPQPNKKFGFVVDLSLDRVLDTVVSEFASNLYSSSMSRKEALKYILLCQDCQYQCGHVDLQTQVIITNKSQKSLKSWTISTFLMGIIQS